MHQNCVLGKCANLCSNVVLHIPLSMCNQHFISRISNSSSIYSFSNMPLLGLTIHKTPGIIVDEIVIDMTSSKGHHRNGQAYVTLCHVRMCEKLHTINYRQKQIWCCDKVNAEIECLREYLIPDISPQLLSTADLSRHIVLASLNVHEIFHRHYSKCADILGDEKHTEGRCNMSFLKHIFHNTKLL